MKTRRSRTVKTTESKIEIAKQLLEKAKLRYEKAAANLKMLMDHRDEERKREFLDAIGKSDRTYEEILNFIRAIKIRTCGMPRVLVF